MAVLLAALLGSALAACVPPEDGSAETRSILGGWTRMASADCVDSLAFAGDGSYAHGLALTVGGDRSTRQVRGAFAGGVRTAADGTLAVTLTPDVPWADGLPADCDGWRQSTRLELPFASVAAGTGVDPAALAYRSVPRPGGGWAWVGTDPLLERDRFALVRDGTTLRGFALDPPPAAEPALFHRVPLDLPSVYPLTSVTAVVNLPQQSWQGAVTGVALDSSVGKLLLSVHSAVEAAFTVRPVGSLYPLCKLVVWNSYDFLAPVDPNPLANVDTDPTVILNPLDALGALVTASHTVGAQTETLYLLPVEVRTPADSGACEINISARPLAGRRVEAHLALPAGDDPLSVPLADAPAFLLAASRPSVPGLTALPLDGFSPAAEVALTGHLVQPPAAAPALLDDAEGAPRPLRLSVTGSGAGTQLNVFPGDGGNGGLGPFLHPAPLPAGDPLEPGVPLDVTQNAGDPPRVLAFTLAARTLLTLYSSGGVPTAARLVATDGTLAARASGGPADGAPDGAGFRIVAALEAGDYRLSVQATGPPATYAVHLEPLTSQGPADLFLEACLRSAAPAGTPPADLASADCTGWPVTNLAGIGAYSGLRRLRLDGSNVSDSAPLAALPRLESLSLARTRVQDVSSLAPDLLLHRLSLAGTALDATVLPGLGALGTLLTEVDLRDVRGLGPDELAALRTALPNALIVAPDGTRVP